MNFEKFKFNPINWDLIDTGNVGLCYSNDSLLADTEIGVERIEANRIGFPRDYPIATHTWGIIRRDSDLTITRTHGIWFLKKTVMQVLKAGVAYVCEETITGAQINEAKVKYGDSQNIEVLCRIDSLTTEEKSFMERDIITYWRLSVAYGWLNFPAQLIHCWKGKDIINYVKGSEICSGFWARIANDVRKFTKKVIDFTSDAATNPFEWQISEIWIRDTKVQPMD